MQIDQELLVNTSDIVWMDFQIFMEKQIEANLSDSNSIFIHELILHLWDDY